jgi:hypothetical protein
MFKKWWFAIVVFIVFAACSSNTSNSNQTTQSTGLNGLWITHGQNFIEEWGLDTDTLSVSNNMPQWANADTGSDLVIIRQTLSAVSTISPSLEAFPSGYIPFAYVPTSVNGEADAWTFAHNVPEDTIVVSDWMQYSQGVEGNRYYGAGIIFVKVQ